MNYKQPVSKIKEQIISKLDHNFGVELNLSLIHILFGAFHPSLNLCAGHAGLGKFAEAGNHGQVFQAQIVPGAGKRTLRAGAPDGIQVAPASAPRACGEGACLSGKRQAAEMCIRDSPKSRKSPNASPKNMAGSSFSNIAIETATGINKIGRAPKTAGIKPGVS